MAYKILSQPAYVLVGGLCHNPAFFEPLISQFNEKKIDAVAFKYRTVGLDANGSTQLDEISAISDLVLSILDVKKCDDVFICHSYGGWVGSRAIINLDKESRQNKGMDTGIIEAIFMAAFIIPDNARTSDVRELPSWLDYGVRMLITFHHIHTWTVILIDLQKEWRTANQRAIPAVFSDMDEQTQRYCFQQLKPNRMTITTESHPNAPWHLALPKTYVICTKDKCIPPMKQLEFLSLVIDETWVVKSIGSGHEPSF